MKKFYKNYRSHIWLLVLAAIFAIIFSIWVFYNQTPLVCGLSSFLFGLILLYAGIKLAPIRAQKKCFTIYNWEWILCIVMAIALWIFWELRMPNHAKTLIIVVGVLAWYAVVYLLGMFFINSARSLYDSLNDYE